MKKLLLALACIAILSGCAIVPAYGPPGYYAPAVVVPYGGYGHRGGYRGYR